MRAAVAKSGVDSKAGLPVLVHVMYILEPVMHEEVMHRVAGWFSKFAPPLPARKHHPIACMLLYNYVLRFAFVPNSTRKDIVSLTS